MEEDSVDGKPVEGNNALEELRKRTDELRKRNEILIRRMNNTVKAVKALSTPPLITKKRGTK